MFYEDLHDSQVLVYKKIAKEHNKRKVEDMTWKLSP